MEHSKVYKELFEQLNATGVKKEEGYYSRVMEEIYDWEREEVEEVIWKAFHKNDDVDLAKFLPKLKKYDGIKALKEALVKCSIPSRKSITISLVLYENTRDDKYMDVFKKNIDKDKTRKVFVSAKRRKIDKEWNIKVPHFYCMEYYEGDKKMIIDIDMRDPVTYLSPRMIEHWEKPYEDVKITMEDKRRILQNIWKYMLLAGADPENIVMEDM